MKVRSAAYIPGWWLISTAYAWDYFSRWEGILSNRPLKGPKVLLRSSKLPSVSTKRNGWPELLIWWFGRFTCGWIWLSSTNLLTRGFRRLRLGFKYPWCKNDWCSDGLIVCWASVNSWKDSMPWAQMSSRGCMDKGKRLFGKWSWLCGWPSFW